MSERHVACERSMPNTPSGMIDPSTWQSQWLSTPMSVGRNKRRNKTRRQKCLICDGTQNTPKLAHGYIDERVDERIDERIHG